MRKILLLLLLANICGTTYGQNYSVQLQSGTFVPKIRDIKKISRVGGEVVNGSIYRYLQFYSIPGEEEKKELLKRGIKILSYVPNNTYIAAVANSVSFSDLDSRNIRAIFPIQAKNKLDLLLAKKKYPKWALRANGTIELIVLHFEGLPQDDVANWLTSKGARISHSLPQMNGHRIIVKLTDINKIASLPYVSYLEPVEENPQPDNLVGRTDHRSNMLATEYSTGLKYDGTGVNVALNDDGVIGPHIDYQGRLISQYITFNNGNHGDHTAGTIIAAGNIDPKGRGMAFGASLGVYGVSGTYPSGYQAFDSIYNHYNSLNIRITSTSYSDGSNTGYTTKARLMDQQITDMPELMHVFSSGNAGTSTTSFGVASWGNITGGHKQAKDVITVGNLNYQDVLESSSSRGPAYDGRIKPDICAVGKDVYSTIDANTYALKTGTSMACPGVAGTLAQLYQGYKVTHGGVNPQSSLIKAAVLNTADDLGNAGPDFKYGWGRINARRAFALLQGNQFLLDSISQAGNKTHPIAVPAGVSELRVMVYWADAKATAGVARALVNNLNMTITSPTSQTMLPWILNPLPNATTLNLPAVQGVDTLNNMEQVTITSPAAGNYIVNVTGASVPQGPQKYYVVYEFVTSQVTLIYPSGGESIVPAVQETIRWDAYGNTGTFNLEYSTNNGSSWTSIATNIAATQRYYNWTPPAVVTGQALVRVTRGTLSDVSDAHFSIIGVPSGLTVNWVCIDSIKVTYNAVTNATGYLITRLGSKYMDSAGFSTTTSCILHGINTSQAGWLSVQAVAANNCKGRRALAINYSAAPFNCSIPDDIGIVQYLLPKAESIIDCQNSVHNDTVSIQIKNNGTTAVSNITAKYIINGGALVTETIAGPLSPQATKNYTFIQPVLFPGAGSYAIKAWVEHPIDMTPGNDTIVWEKLVLSPQQISLPYIQNFETFSLCDTSANCEVEVCQLSDGWINSRNGVDDYADWRINYGPTPSFSQLGTTGPAMDFSPGTATGQYAYLESSGCYGKEASLISPCIDITNAVNPRVTYAYHMFGGGMGSLHVDVLSNGQWINDVVPATQGDQGNGWKQQTVSLSSYIGKVINLRFRGITGASETSDMALDNVVIAEASGVDNLADLMTADVFPNPSTGYYNVQVNSVSSQLDITVADVNGKLLEKKTLMPTGRSLSTNLQLGRASAGIYILTIRGEKGVLNKKLIKL